jgi:hypothetical protein
LPRAHRGVVVFAAFWQTLLPVTVCRGVARLLEAQTEQSLEASLAGDSWVRVTQLVRVR